MFELCAELVHIEEFVLWVQAKLEWEEFIISHFELVDYTFDDRREIVVQQFD
jgi:hypothetical protein